MYDPFDSLVISHLKVKNSIEHVMELLDDPGTGPNLWRVLMGVRDLEAARGIHLENLYDCLDDLRPVHWTITPIVQVAILKNQSANEPLISIRAELHRRLCSHTEDEPRYKKLRGELARYSQKLAEIEETEKNSVLKMLEILGGYSQVLQIS